MGCLELMGDHGRTRASNDPFHRMHALRSTFFGKGGRRPQRQVLKSEEISSGWTIWSQKYGLRRIHVSWTSNDARQMPGRSRLMLKTLCWRRKWMNIWQNKRMSAKKS
jgi:hypothetical protein